MVACGDEHTLALAEDGTIYAWGNNTFGQLGVGDIRQRDRPTKVIAEGVKFASVHAGGQHSHALNGTILHPPVYLYLDSERNLFPQ